MHQAEIRVHVAALYVALTKAGEYEAAAALLEWADEWLDNFDEEQLVETFEVEDDA